MRIKNDPSALSYNDQLLENDQENCQLAFAAMFRRADEIYDGPGRLSGQCDEVAEGDGYRLEPNIREHCRPVAMTVYEALDRYEDMLIARLKATREVKSHWRS